MECRDAPVGPLARRTVIWIHRPWRRPNQPKSAASPVSVRSTTFARVARFGDSKRVSLNILANQTELPKSFFACLDPSPGGIKELTQGALWSKNAEKRVLSRPHLRCQRCHSPRARCFSSPPKKSTDPKKTHFGCYSISVFPVFFIVLDDSKWLS